MIYFTHTIFYVKNVEKTLSFYEAAFGFKRRFVHETGTYGELETGNVTLAFASEELAYANLNQSFVPQDLKNPPAACEIAFTTKDVSKALAQALKNGAIKISDPQEKPWGQIVAYVRDPQGILIEIASPLA